MWSERDLTQHVLLRAGTAILFFGVFDEIELVLRIRCVATCEDLVLRIRTAPFTTTYSDSLRYQAQQQVQGRRIFYTTADY